MDEILIEDIYKRKELGFPGGSDGKEKNWQESFIYSTHKSTRRNIGECNRKMVAQIVKNLPVMQET